MRLPTVRCLTAGVQTFSFAVFSSCLSSECVLPSLTRLSKDHHDWLLRVGTLTLWVAVSTRPQKITQPFTGLKFQGLRWFRKSKLGTFQMFSTYLKRACAWRSVQVKTRRLNWSATPLPGWLVQARTNTQAALTFPQALIQEFISSTRLNKSAVSVSQTSPVFIKVQKVRLLRHSRKVSLVPSTARRLPHTFTTLWFAGHYC